MQNKIEKGLQRQNLLHRKYLKIGNSIKGQDSKYAYDNKCH